MLKLITVFFFIFLSPIGNAQNDVGTQFEVESGLEQCDTFPETCAECLEAIDCAEKDYQNGTRQIFQGGIVHDVLYADVLMRKHKIHCQSSTCSPTLFEVCYNYRMQKLLKKELGNEVFEITKKQAHTKFDSISLSPNHPPILLNNTIHNIYNFHLNYFDTEISTKTKPVVKISFLLKKNREKTNFQIIEGLGEPFDSEAMRMMKFVHYFRPAKVDNQFVDSIDTLQIVFDPALKLKYNCLAK